MWLLRVAFGVMLMFGTELLLWIDPPGRPIVEWGVLLVGYIALSTLTLDLAARFRIRGLYEAMALLAIYGLLAALLLNSERVFTDFPRTLATRAIGAHAFTGLLMFGYLLAFTGGHIQRMRRNLLGASIWVGFYWGIWVRWSPSLIDWIPDEVSLATMLLMLLLMLLITWGLLAAFLSRKPAITLDALRLPITQWLMLVLVLIALFLVQVLRGEITEPLAIPASALLIAVSWAVLYFRRANKGRTLFDKHLPPTPLSPLWIAASTGLFAVMAVLAYSLPYAELFGYNQLAIMEIGFALVGFGWYPVIAGVIGARAFEQQLRTQQL